MNKVILSIFLILVSLIFVSCAEQEGPTERAGENIDDGIENSGEAISDSIEDAGDKIEDATDSY
tara:strand:- start:463 stop:654 length:192 start_codon:yes stop_codon:yes gene_type:complete